MLTAYPRGAAMYQRHAVGLYRTMAVSAQMIWILLLIASAAAISSLPRL